MNHEFKSTVNHLKNLINNSENNGNKLLTELYKNIHIQNLLLEKKIERIFQCRKCSKIFDDEKGRDFEIARITKFKNNSTDINMIVKCNGCRNKFTRRISQKQKS